MPLRLTLIPYISAACLAVTDCFTASNTFISKSPHKIEKKLTVSENENNKCLSNLHVPFFPSFRFAVPIEPDWLRLPKSFLLQAWNKWIPLFFP